MHIHKLEECAKQRTNVSTCSYTRNRTYNVVNGDMDQFHKVANEAHHEEADTDGMAHLNVLWHKSHLLRKRTLAVRLRTPVQEVHTLVHERHREIDNVTDPLRHGATIWSERRGACASDLIT